MLKQPDCGDLGGHGEIRIEPQNVAQMPMPQRELATQSPAPAEQGAVRRPRAPAYAEAEAEAEGLRDKLGGVPSLARLTRHLLHDWKPSAVKKPSPTTLSRWAQLLVHELNGQIPE